MDALREFFVYIVRGTVASWMFYTEFLFIKYVGYPIFLLNPA